MKSASDNAYQRDLRPSKNNTSKGGIGAYEMSIRSMAVQYVQYKGFVHREEIIQHVKSNYRTPDGRPVSSGSIDRRLREATKVDIDHPEATLELPPEKSEQYFIPIHKLPQGASPQ